ncbi:unnamed protein product [Vicia faba]|uniref:Reverse transcriptase zinc-binding domain-containing protein n=1 Tax=Vicia faba TaxID=3906 RepID=A0AAV0ZYS0_VICFA|nr:unnamed protein product [Vicia faba]
MQVPPILHHNLKAMLQEIIEGNSITLPPSLVQLCPALPQLTANVFINPLKEDMKVWEPESSGQLSVKAAYGHLSSVRQATAWGGIIWNYAILPSKSILFWRLVFGKLSTDDNLQLGGLHMPSYCSLCTRDGETLQHLFFSCRYAEMCGPG